jgi:asparagine synthase (glutamine-hydrolysing)
MCGIVALFSPRGIVSSSDLEKATRRLVARGPDGQKQWIAGHGRVGLGHARLSIIDLQTGDQPIESEDGRTHIVVNGEFYDHERIQRELEARGHRLRTRSDSEIALHLYQEQGASCMRELRGEFAFALWDEDNQVLFAARDRFGIKPLFYAVHGGRSTSPRRSRRCSRSACRPAGTGRRCSARLPAPIRPRRCSRVSSRYLRATT